MAFKDLLVHLDDSDICSQKVEAALALAKRQEASVRGVALALESTIASYAGVTLPSSLTQAQKEIVEKATTSAIEKFEKAATEAGVEYTSEIIRCGATKAPNRLSYCARHADMCFLSQPNVDEEGSTFQESLLEGVLLSSGRPVYIVPYIGRPNYQVRKAVIAWDGGKKSVRALNDAIPLLQGRGEAIVLVVDPDSRRDVHGDKPGANIVAHLERHGVKASVDCRVSDGVSPDAVILNTLADRGADLLVMGAFGHSRLRERAFGGVTNTILHQMTTPVLMSE